MRRSAPPYTSTLTAKIAGRPLAGILPTASLSTFASSGHRFRHSGSTKVTITGRP